MGSRSLDAVHSARQLFARLLNRLPKLLAKNCHCITLRALIAGGIMLLWLVIYLSISAFIPKPILANHEYAIGNSSSFSLRFCDHVHEVTILRMPTWMSEKNSPPQLLLAVLSSVDNTEMRQAIRETWGSHNTSQALREHRARMFFIVGKSLKEDSVEQLETEADQFSDLVLIDTIDTYSNLVYKSLTILHIANNFCQAAFIVKIDEDTIFHIDRFFAFQGHPFSSNETAFYCFTWKRRIVHRTPLSPWYVPSSKYAPSHFPPYCSGPVYVMTNKAAKKAIGNLPKTPMIMPEDALVTGLLSPKAKKVHLPAMFPILLSSLDTCVRLPALGIRQLIAVHEFKTVKALREGWQMLQEECDED